MVLFQDMFLIAISIPEGCSIIFTLTSMMENVSKPALECLKDYGLCTDLQKSYFFHGVDTFIKFLKSRYPLKVIDNRACRTEWRQFFFNFLS